VGSSQSSQAVSGKELLKKMCKQETQRLKKKQKNSDFLFCLLSCESHKVQTTAEFKMYFENWLYQWRKLSFGSWASGGFWGRIADYASYPISALYVPSGYRWGLNNLTGQERGTQGVLTALNPQEQNARESKCQ